MFQPLEIHRGSISNEGCTFLCTLSLEHRLCKHSNSLIWVRATLTEFMACPSLHIATRLPRWITVWHSIGHMSKASYSGSTSLKRSANWSTGLLNEVELEESKKGKEVSALGSIPLGHCFPVIYWISESFLNVFHTFHPKWTLTRGTFMVWLY